MVIRIKTATADCRSESGVVDCDYGMEAGFFIVDKKDLLVLVLRDKI